MKKTLLTFVVLTITLIMVTSCSDNTDKEGDEHITEKQEKPEDNSTQDKEDNQSVSEEDTDTNATEPNESPDEDSTNENDSNDSNDQSVSKNNQGLSDYSSQDIEYARVWLQLGENQNIETLYVERIPAGEPLNPDDETSVDYPEDVVQLSGPRLVDGVVTYSSNGDGTVNVYKVPKRWDGKNPAGKDTYEKMINQTEQEPIDPGEDEKVEQLIEILEIY